MANFFYREESGNLNKKRKKSQINLCLFGRWLSSSRNDLWHVSGAEISWWFRLIYEPWTWTGYKKVANTEAVMLILVRIPIVIPFEINLTVGSIWKKHHSLNAIFKFIFTFSDCDVQKIQLLCIYVFECDFQQDTDNITW